MAADDIPPVDMAPEHDEAPPPRRWWRWLILFGVLVPLVLALIIPAGLWFLSETPGGRSFVARQISGIKPESGMRFQVGRIDGSLFSAFSLHDLVVHDLDGPMAELPVVEVSWRPFSLVGRLISLDSLEVPEARLLRMPRLNPGDPDDPLLPDIDIHIGRFNLSRLVLAEPVLGTPEEVTALGRVDIRSGRLLLDMQAATATGDRMSVLLDAEPDADKFDVKADVRAPRGGLVSRVSGFDQGTAIEVSGAGTWSQWRGRLVADVLSAPPAAAASAATGVEGGVARVADLAIMGDAGQFRIQGELLPESLLPEALAQLTAPAVKMDATVRREGDVFGMQLAAGSDALAVSASGALDVRRNRLIDVRGEVELLRPDLVDPALIGEDVKATLVADGPLQNAKIGWTVVAGRLGFGAAGEDPMGVEGLSAGGDVVLPGEERPLAVTFAVEAARIMGVPEAAAELLAKPRVSGVVTMRDGGGIHVGDIKAQTTQLLATGTADMTAEGRLIARLDGDMQRFDVPQMGPVRARAQVRVDRPANGAMAVDGNFNVRSLELTNEGVRNFLGGLPTLAGNFRMAPDGVVRVEKISLTSPQLNFADARASYDPANGRFTLTAAGRSTAYGPVLVEASGTADAPRATISLASPGLGVGLTNVVADITPIDDGFAIVARGESPQGPLDGRVRLLLADGQPMVVDIQRVQFAGIHALGRLTQTDAGPFAGQIRVDGRGLEARVDLSVAGSVQRIDGVATARNARIPLDPVIAITSGQAQFRATMTPDRPTIVGDFSVKGLRRDTLALTDARGRIDLTGTNGTGRITAAGSFGGGKPFKLTSNLQSTPQGYTVGLDGTIDRQPIKLTSPARIMVRQDGMELLPTRLQLPEGQIDIAGLWGEKRELRLTLNKVDLSAVDYVAGDFGLGGTASGTVAVRLVPGAPVPQGEANIRIDKLMRAGLAGVSAPVDMVLTAQSTGDGLAMGGRISWQGNSLGRLVMRIAPGEGADMTERFMAGRLSGGVRYNGPVEPLWALAAPEGQELSGAIAVGVDFAGTVSAPELTGVARGRSMAYRNAQFGTAITDISFAGQFHGPYFRLANFQGTAGKGTLRAQGRMNLSPGEARRINMEVQLDNAKLADSDLIEGTISGPLRLSGQGDQLALTGDLQIDSAWVQVVQMQTADVPVLKVRRVGDVAVPPADAASSMLAAISLDVRIRANDVVRVEGMGLDSTWRADVRVEGTAAAPQIFGQATLAEGEFTFASSDFDITSGRITLNGAPMESSINIQAQTVAQDVTAYVTIAGTAARPQINFSSTPTLPEDEILARLLFGASVADLSVAEAVQLASAVASLQSGGVGTIGKIRRGIGLDRLRLVGENGDTGMGTGLAVGKRLSKRVYLEVLTDSGGNTLTTLQWTLSRLWSLIGEVSSMGHSSMNARYQKEY